MTAADQGADYVAFGAFYPTATKASQGHPSPQILSNWSLFTTVPCVAIGGITPSNCAPLVQSGADFLAVVAAVWDHPAGPGAAVKAFNQAIERAHGYRPSKFIVNSSFTIAPLKPTVSFAIRICRQHIREFAMKINGNAIRPGMVIEHKTGCGAVKTAHTQPGRWRLSSSWTKGYSERHETE